MIDALIVALMSGGMWKAGALMLPLGDSS